MKLRKMLAASAVAGAVFVALPATAALADSYKNRDGSTINNTTPQAGGSVTVHVGGFASGSSVTIEAQSTPIMLGTFQADASGWVDATVTVPSTLSGSHHIVASGTNSLGAPVVVSLPITVSQAGVTQPTATPTESNPTSFLPRTGSNTMSIVLAGGVLMIVGGAAVVATRKRQTVTAD